MAHISIAKDYELKYWRAHQHERYERAQKMIDMFDLQDKTVDDDVVVADIGCGPRCGIFHAFKCNTMYAVDPLWGAYKKNKLTKIPKGVTTIKGEAETFKLPQKADVIVSVNALDHSGSLSASFANIMDNLVHGGYFCLHVHMRTKKQLNKGHRMLITESEIDSFFDKHHLAFKRIYDSCPIEGKPYRSYVAAFIKEG